MPDIDINGYLSINELNRIREKHIKKLLESDSGELTNMDKEVVDSLTKNDILSKNIDNDFDD